MNESKIPKFRRCVLQNFPFIEEDFDALTDYELLCKVVQYLNMVIDKVNKLDGMYEELNDAFVQLKNYVDTYFDNLDVQEEINNKLDDMAEGGELAAIIAQFLEIAPVFGYNTISAMASATNLSNGCIARVLGNTVATNGDGAFYMIRNKTGADDPDGVNLVAIGDSLVGVRVPDAGYNSLQSDINGIDARLDLIENKKYVFIGDSYLAGYTPSGTIENWGTKVANALGLESSQYTIVAYGGSGFVREDTKTFTQMVNELSVDNDVTDVILAGGYNDIGANFDTIFPYMTTFKSACLTKFPNATIRIGFIGGTTNGDNLYSLSVVMEAYKKGCARLGIRYMNNVEYCLKKYYTDFTNDTIHPNSYGQQSIADAITQAILNGAADVQLTFTNINITPSISQWTVTTGNFGCTVNNNITTLYLQEVMTFSANSGQTLNMICDNRGYLLGTITSGYVVGAPSRNTEIPINCVIGYADGYAQAQGKLVISNSSVVIFLYNTDKLTGGTNFMSLNGVYMIQIQSALNSMDSSLC